MMLFNYELKKIWRRISPMAVLIILLVTSILTTSLTFIFFNQKPVETPDVSTEYQNLSEKILNWNTSVNRESFAEAFNNFHADFKKMNASTFDGNNLVEDYNTAKNSFNYFYVEYYQRYINGSQNEIANYLLIKKSTANNLNDIFSVLDLFFRADYTTNVDINNGLHDVNTTWESKSPQTNIDNLFYIQTIKPELLANLQLFCKTYSVDKTDFDYTDAYEYVLHRYWVDIATSSTYKGELSQYVGFENFQNTTLSTQTYKLAGYRVNNANKDYATPYTFGKIYTDRNQISLFDFVFTNMEMATFIIVILTMIWAGCAFFTDKHQSTLVTPIAIGKKRPTIIITKMLAVITLAISSILIMTTAYITVGLLLGAKVGPDILFLFNGTQTSVLSPLSYYFIYFLSLLFKLLPLIALSGLFSFTKAKPFVIIGLSLLIYIIILTSNYFLSSFTFYQFVPLLALDPITYYGAEMLLSTMPNTYNFWYTLPSMFSITALLYWLLICKFKKHDFY